MVLREIFTPTHTKNDNNAQNVPFHSKMCHYKIKIYWLDKTSVSFACMYSVEIDFTLTHNNQCLPHSKIKGKNNKDKRNFHSTFRSLFRCHCSTRFAPNFDICDERLCLQCQRLWVAVIRNPRHKNDWEKLNHFADSLEISITSKWCKFSLGGFVRNGILLKYGIFKLEALLSVGVCVCVRCLFVQIELLHLLCVQLCGSVLNTG